MSPKTKRSPVVVTVKPTIIRIGPPDDGGIEDWHGRFIRPVAIAAGMAAAVGLASFATSFHNSLASFWLGFAGLLATGAVLYRELCRAGLVPGRIAGLALAFAPMVPGLLLALLPIPLFEPIYVAAVSCGLLTGWAAHAIGALADSA